MTSEVTNSTNKEKQLLVLAETVSQKFYSLQNSVSSFDGQSLVFDTQKPLLVAAMMTYDHVPADVAELFARDGAINDITQAITVSIAALSSETNYATFQQQLADLETAIAAYFDVALTGI